MRFVLMFKINALGTSREGHPPDVTLGPLYHVFNYKTPNSLVFQAHL